MNPRPARIVRSLLGLCGTWILLAACNGDSADSLRASGQAYLDKKDAVSAVIQLKAALQKDPNAAATRLLLGRALLEAGDAAGASVELAKLLDLRRDDPQALPLLARALLASNAAQRLTSQYGASTLAEPQPQAALQTALAAAWAQQGDAARARAALAAALAAVPRHMPALVLQARLAAASGQAEEALSRIQAALALDGSSAEAWVLDGELRARLRNDAAGAAQSYARALAADPAHVPAHLALISQRLQAGDVAQAKTQAALLRVAMPRHPQTLYVDARLALIDGDLKLARERVQQLLRMAPEQTGVLQLAAAIEAQAGWMLLAESYLQKALQIDPGLTTARRDLAQIRLRLGQPQRALQMIEPLVQPDSSDAEALALAGEARLQSGDAPAAEALYQRAARLTPADSRVRTALAMVNLARGDAASAFAQLDAIAADTPDTAAEMAMLSARLKRGETDAALRVLDAMERKQPGSATVAELRGLVYGRRRQFGPARAALEAALQREPSRYSAIARLAALDVREGQPARARRRFEAVIAADPRNAAARMALASLMEEAGAGLPELRELLVQGIKAAPAEAGPRLQLLELLIAKRQFKDALTVAQEAIAALPDDPGVLDALGRAQVLAGETQQANSTFHRAAQVDPRATLPLLRLADLHKSAGNREVAVANLRRALEIDPDLEAAQGRLIDLLLADNRGAEALTLAQGMQQRAPQSAAGYLFEGAIQQRLKAPDRATRAYRAGLEQARRKSELATSLHRLLLAGGQDAEAERFAARWLNEHPDDMDFASHAAATALLRRQLSRAEALLREVVAARPTDAPALNNLAWVTATLGKPGAVALAQRALDQRPDQPQFMDTLALALAADKQWAEALSAQKRAVALAPAQPTLRLNLARIAIQAGDKALARGELQRLASEDPKLPIQPEVQHLLRAL